LWFRRFSRPPRNEPMPDAAEQPLVSPDARPLEGGDVRPLEDYPVAERHRAETARYLAYALVGILAMSIVLQYGLTIWAVFSGKPEGVASLDKIFSVLLPALAGLVGGASTYYFTREKS